MPALPQRPGKADRSIASKASRNRAIRDYERRWSSSPGYGCAISRTRRSPSGSTTAENATVADLHGLAYNMKRVMRILGIGGLMAAMRA